MKKVTGVLLWIIGLALMVRYVTSINSPSRVALAGISLFILLFSVITIFNWLWGHQKGHIAHLSVIVLYALLALILNIETYVPFIWFFIFISFFFFAFIYIVLKFRTKFVSDFNNGIIRNHFT